MGRLRTALLPSALLAAIAVAGIGVSAAFERESAADLENGVFTSRADQLQLVVPRGWRASDQPSYPGILLWMLRSQPQGQIVLTAEPFTRTLYCSWPISCRTSHDALPGKFACALRIKLQSAGMHVGPVQAGPRDTDPSGLSSVWFEYDDGRRFLRQAVALSDDRAVSLVMSAPSNEARASYVRPFDQALRTLRTVSAAAAGSADAAVATAPGDGGVKDGGVELAQTPKVNPVGPCPQQTTE